MNLLKITEKPGKIKQYTFRAIKIGDEISRKVR